VEAAVEAAVALAAEVAAAEVAAAEVAAEVAEVAAAEAFRRALHGNSRCPRPSREHPESPGSPS
jgi:hypothetical protein